MRRNDEGNEMNALILKQLGVNTGAINEFAAQIRSVRPG